MFEFEIKGDIKELEKFENELLEYMGFGSRGTYSYKRYDELAQYYRVKELTHKHENQMEKDFSPVLFCSDFPTYTSPFWNMKKHGESHAHKIDVIMYGDETIGSAERSTDPVAMRESFYTISNGKYAEKLFGLFGKERVERELDDFLKLDFFPRSGGGIGLTRMINAAKKGDIMNALNNNNNN
jgi:aspartyl/asparaginyl-tRNA synthetase